MADFKSESVAGFKSEWVADFRRNPQLEKSALLPMAIGIRDSLFAGTDTKRRKEVLRALVTITRSLPYAQALLTDDAMRFDINGAIVEPVSQEHRAGARSRLERFRAAPTTPMVRV